MVGAFNVYNSIRKAIIPTDRVKNKTKQPVFMDIIVIVVIIY